MIELNLRLFGGRGGGSDGVGADKNNSSGSKNQQTQQNAEQSGPQKKKIIMSKTPAKSIDANEEYVVARYERGQETDRKRASGERLLGLIRANRLTYDNNRDAWILSGKRYVLRKILRRK